MNHMVRPSIQAPGAVVMIRPHHFSPNPETRADNAFQRHAVDGTHLGGLAREQVDAAAAALEAEGVRVHVFDDDTRQTPDSVFPNNWFSTHAGGHVAIYPMYAPNRRRERRVDIIDMLKRDYRVQDVIDYSGLEADGLFLEGTGAMVLDHLERVAYAVRSKRTSPVALERFCTHFNYEPMVFDAAADGGAAVYHTNVLMCIATDVVLIGAGLIDDTVRRREVVERLAQPGREIVELTARQISRFAGNAMELTGSAGRLLALSRTAYGALTAAQRRAIERHVNMVPLDVSAVEHAGGSVRCMLAGIHLTAR